MGAWGTLPFENDAALDWVAELESDGIPAIRGALQRAAGSEYLDADDASAAVGAAATVAAARGAYRTALPPEVSAWIESHQEEVTSDLVNLSERALDEVMKSELQELWEETEELDAWTQSVEAIRSVLTSR